METRRYLALFLATTVALTTRAAVMAPVAVTGFNRDLMVEASAPGPPFTGAAVELNPGEGLAYYESGLPGKTQGLPGTGSFLSALGDGTQFQLQPYTANNALVLSSGTGISSGTLTLVTPATFARIAIIANSAGGGGTATLTLHFSDGGTFVTTYNASDWFNNTDFALQGFQRLSVSSGTASGGTTNPRFYQTTLDLNALLGAGGNKRLVSLSFDQAAGAGSTGIYGVSGEIAPDAPASITNGPTNTTVIELAPTILTAVVGGIPYPALQWLKGGVAISGATNATYAIAAAALVDNGATFRLVASNVASSVSYSVTSSVATLTVIADTNKPVLTGAFSLGLSQVQVGFSERIKLTTATNKANYFITGTNGALAISGAAFDPSQSNVLLNVATMINGAVYTLTINNLADQSVAANVITPNSQTSFTASPYAPLAIGSPTPAGGLVTVANGFNLSGGGADAGGTNDQFQFSYLPVSGDFDLRVRLDSLSLADAWSEAGMVAREDLTPGARSASVMATPTISGCYFQSRGATNGATTLSGSYPVNYPNTWLRLKRAGNDFTGFASFDGSNWAQLGTVSIAMPAAIYFGFAVSSHNTNQLATAAFRDFSNVTVAGSGLPSANEPLGQASRRTSLVISEIMFHPADTRGAINTNAQGFMTNSLEFVEIFNSRGEPENLGGYRLSGAIDYTFPANTILPGGGFLVIARSPADIMALYGITGVLGPFTNNLPNDSGTIRLRNQADGVFLEVNYSDQSPWPVSADGAGHSLVLARPSYGQDNPLAWSASDAIGGSPGRLDPFTSDPLRNVVINEFLAHTDDPEVDYIELYNHGNQSVDISGCILTDDPTTNKFVIPATKSIPAHGFVYFTQTNMNFSLGAEGETIYLKNAAQTRFLDAVQFGGQENGVASGRFPDGDDQFYRLKSKTPGAANAPILVSDIVINEIMCAPVSLNGDDQFVELFNRGTNPVNLAGWKLSDAISFTFPSNTVLAANAYLVVAKNSQRMMSNYANLNPANTLGNFSGKFGGNGERLALTMPDTVVITNGVGVVETNLIHITMDEVTYQAGGRWPKWANGGGSSLELIDPRSNHRFASNWAGSDETHKAPWTIVSATGALDNGNVAADQLQVLLQGVGECLVDNVQVLDASSNNYIANWTFETDASGWTAEGTESTSGLETSEGYLSSKSYHVRAVDRGDNQINRIRTPLISPLASGTAGVTLRAAVRWLKGHPEILLRLRGNWLECAGEMTLPANPGTPGARNSRYATNAPPAITQVKHSPVLPAANQPIVVTARAHDPDGVSSFVVKYRLDPAAAYSTVVMTDNGTGGDAVPGDGIFSAMIPGQAGGSMIAFYVQSTDGFAPAATSTFPGDAPAHECLVRVGEVQPTGNFPVYRVWMTQATLSAWTTRAKLDNSPLDVTFVLGDERVIYNAEAQYAGSPYIAPGYSGPTSGRCGYSLSMPADDLFLGERDLVLDWPGGHGGETSAMQEQMGYWIADRLNLPFSHRYIIRLHVNGVTDVARQAVFEAVNQPAGDFLKAWSPDDSDGEFFKVDRAFEFNDAGGLTADPQPRLQNYTTTGGAKKREKYRWNWNHRSADRLNNYTNIFALVDALNSTAPEPYTTATMGIVDAEEWMRIFATEHIIVNFDAYGHQIGKNMYAFLPGHGKWQLFMFDLDWLMLAAVGANSSYAPGTAPLFNTEDPTVTRMFAHPPFARAYWRAIEDAVNGPLISANCDPVMDAKYQSLLANGIVWCDAKPLSNPSVVKNWFSQRRAGLQAQLATVAAPFAVNSPVPVTNNVGYLSGTAPIGAKTIWINGTEWSVTWTSVTNWKAGVPLQPGTNILKLVGVDEHGQPLPGASNTVSAVYSGTASSPVGAVVINEIMSTPLVTGAEYVEFFNTSTTNTFDLSGWSVNGLSYTFHGGALISPRSFLVLAKDRVAFDIAYGPDVLVAGDFDGNLQSEGETISLIKPGALPGQETVVDRVRYEAMAPWPTNVPGSSLQLFDAAQDNARVANWGVVISNAVPPPSQSLLNYTSVWKFMQVSDLDAVNWKATNYNDSSWPAGPSLLAFESNAGITPLIHTTLNDPRTATNGMPGGHAYYFRTSLNLTSDLSAFTVTASAYIDDGAVIYVNGTEIPTRVRMNAGTVTNGTFASAQPSGGDATTPDTFTIPSSMFVPGLNVLAVEVHQNTNTSTDIVFGMRLDADFTGSLPNGNPATPGTTNSVSMTLPGFPPVWLNELQADNLTGPLDNFGQREPWIELHNAGPNSLSLSNLFLSDSYTNLTKWAFPANTTAIPAGGFLVVWCDNQTNQTTTSVPHANFRLGAANGTVALARLTNGAPQILDYLTYSNLAANWSYGDLPDGQPFFRDRMFFTTPGGTNSGTSPPITVIINEWMADNASTRLDPADNDAEDWFELYNPGTNTVDLGGYYLTSVLTNKTKFQVPANGQYTIPPHGFLLVWADSESGQNSTNLADLHTNFKLGKAGDAIGLFAADGTTIDAVTFTNQTTDVSEGRFPDGSAFIFAMPAPTPKTNNVIPNTAPVLSAMVNRVVHAGQAIQFTATATDAQSALQTLGFTLDPGYPAGAMINVASGAFSWTTSAAVPGTNTITVRVTDNGVPPLSDAKSFTVVVQPLPQFGATLPGDGSVQLIFSTLAGQNYQVEFKDDWTVEPWTPLGGPVIGTGGVLMVTNDLDSSPQRFYRLRILP